MRKQIIWLIALAVSGPAWGMAYDTTGVYQVSVRTVDIPTLQGGSTSTMSDSKIYYPAEGSGVAAGAVPCPIVVFGHGFFIDIDQYASYGQHLASWGYVVVIPTISNPFPTPSHYGRAIDMKAAGRYVAGLDTASGDIFYGKLERWNWAFAGHSMGGSIACLAADTLRITDTLKCVVSFSGPQSTPSTHPQHIAQPLLILEASNDQIAPWDEVYADFYQGGGQPATFAVIDGGNHSQFTDSWTAPFGDGSATISRGLQRRYARRYLTAWLERYLKGSRTPLNYHCCFGDSINGHSAMADTVTSRIQNLPPLAVQASKPFDCAALGTTYPSFTFSAWDDDDPLSYRLRLSRQAGMAPSDSADAGNGPSGQQVVYQWPLALEQNGVYYWQTKAGDNLNQWGPFSQISSFTVDTGLPVGSCSWRQGQAGQFSSASFTGLTLSGDSVVLSGTTPGYITGPEVDFHSLSSFWARSHWGFAKWVKGSAADSVILQIEYHSGASWQLVPDAHLPGNGNGFQTNSISGVVSLEALDTLVYQRLRLKASIRSGGSPRPALLCWELGSPTSWPLGVEEMGAAPGISLKASIRWASTPGRIPLAFEVSLPTGGDCRLGIYNLAGQLVHRMDLGAMGPGRYIVKWHPSDGKGRHVASGIYIASLATDGGRVATKALVMR